MRFGDGDLTNVVVAGLGMITVAESYETIRDRVEAARGIPFMESTGDSARMRSPQGPLVHCVARMAFPGFPEEACTTELAFSAENVVGMYRVPAGGLDVD